MLNALIGPKEVSPSQVAPTDEGYQVLWTPREIGLHKCTLAIEAAVPRASRQLAEHSPSVIVQSNVYDVAALRLLRKLPDGSLRAIEPVRSGDKIAPVISRFRAGAETAFTGSALSFYLIITIL